MNNYEFITTNTPVNKTTRLVMSPGFKYTPDKKPNVFHQSVQPPIRSITKQLTCSTTFKDLTGVKRGQLTVIGMSAQYAKRWVVRCVCGEYEIRSGKAILNENNIGDRCFFCMHLANLKRKDLLKRTSKRSIIRDYL